MNDYNETLSIINENGKVELEFIKELSLDDL